MDDPIQLIMAVIGTGSALLWIILFIKNSGKYSEILKTTAASEYQLSSVFFIGFAIMKHLKINVRSEKYALKRSRAAELYGLKYAEFYTYLITGAEVTYAGTIFPVTTLLAATAGSVEFGIMGAIVSLLMLFYIDSDVKKKVEERHDELLCELPDMISRLTILVNAGMVLREAWNKIADSSDSMLCKEMRHTYEDIRNGMPESEAFSAFAERCHTKEIRKFISTLNQNLQKGSTELVSSLQTAAAEQWEEKKNLVKRKGNAVEQKLLLPMIIIFIAIIIMIIVPVFTNIV